MRLDRLTILEDIVFPRGERTVSDSALFLVRPTRIVSSENVVTHRGAGLTVDAVVATSEPVVFDQEVADAELQDEGSVRFVVSAWRSWRTRTRHVDVVATEGDVRTAASLVAVGVGAFIGPEPVHKAVLDESRASGALNLQSITA